MRVFNRRPPELPTFGALLVLWPTWLSYAVSYLFIAIVWINHHYLLRYSTETNLRLLWFNFAHLFSMSLLPFSTAWMANSELAPQPVAFYAAVFFLVNATYICLIWELMGRIPTDQVSLTVRKLMRFRFITTLCLFGAASVVALKYPLARSMHEVPGRHVPGGFPAKAFSRARMGAQVCAPNVKSWSHGFLVHTSG
jgi:uncharacterized membrane protein